MLLYDNVDCYEIKYLIKMLKIRGREGGEIISKCTRSQLYACIYMYKFLCMLTAP